MMEKDGHVLKVLVFTLKTKQWANNCSMTAAFSQIIHKGHMQGKKKLCDKLLHHDEQQAEFY